MLIKGACEFSLSVPTILPRSLWGFPPTPSIASGTTAVRRFISLLALVRFPAALILLVFIGIIAVSAIAATAAPFASPASRTPRAIGAIAFLKWNSSVKPFHYNGHDIIDDLSLSPLQGRLAWIIGFQRRGRSNSDTSTPFS